MKLRGVSFEWNPQMFEKYGYDFKQTNIEDIGFIAQELQLFIPEVVSYKNDRWFVKYDEIVSICIGAIQEQSKVLDAFEQQLDLLENMVQ